MSEWFRRAGLGKKWPDSLACIGENKPMGYSSTRRLNVPWDKTEEEVAARVVAKLESNGLRAFYIDSVEADESRGQIYAWDEGSLQALLDRNRHIVHDDITPEDFVNWVARNVAIARTPLFNLVAEAHGDDWNPGRTDNANVSKDWLDELLAKGPVLKKGHAKLRQTTLGDFGMSSSK